MNAVGASILIALVVVILFLPRRWALLGMMAAVLYLTHAQVLNLFGFNLFAIRIVEVAGFARIFIKKEIYQIEIGSIDKWLALLYTYATAVFLVRSQIDYAFAIGTMIDALLSYFIFRALVLGIEDLKWLLIALVFLLIPYVLLVAIEMLTRNNPFSIIGGLSFYERGGRLRCMGSFRHPSLLGTLGSAFLPLYFGLSLFKGGRAWGLIGIGLCMAIVLLANSGGPVSASAIGMVGWLLWLIRDRMSLFRRTLVVFIILLGLVMKAPIWYLPAKISAFTGGDGWHRSYLMDVAFGDINKWWLFGMGLENTEEWFEYTVPATGVADITNQFIAFGLQAGLLTIGLFITVLVKAFKSVGVILDGTVSTLRQSDSPGYLIWGLGCALAVHISTWLGITYFDQTYFIWFFQLASISSIYQATFRTGAEPIRSVVQKIDNQYQDSVDRLPFSRKKRTK